MEEVGLEQGASAQLHAESSRETDRVASSDADSDSYAESSSSSGLSDAFLDRRDKNTTWTSEVPDVDAEFVAARKATMCVRVPPHM
jgi:hypothetical protein